jgi:3-phosphoshikimate 1-carboxyvinyltransferase
MRQRIVAPRRLEGEVSPPGDKSVSHRAALLNSIARGSATVSNYCAGDDGASMLRCLRSLGASIEALPSQGGASQDAFVIRGGGLHGLTEPDHVLDAGNSGTTMRLVAGLAAGQPFLSVISGDASLRSRPMDRVLGPLREMGAQALGRSGNSRAPLVIRGGSLHGIEYTLPVASAQLKSCLLIAGLYAQGETVLHQPAASRDHTERMLRAMGGRVETEGLRVSVRPSDLTAINVRVPGDISGAAFWLVAGSCHPNARVRVKGVGINPSRTGVLDVLRAMGGRIRLENVREDGGEPTADLVAESGPLVATEIGGDLIPRVIDELPVLAVAACFARGTTVIRDAGELRVKESDRIKTTVEGLRRLGARISASFQGAPVADDAPQRDGMIIQGAGSLKGGQGRSHADHRIAMALGVAGLLGAGDTIVQGAEAADVSYPQFWAQLHALCGEPARPDPAGAGQRVQT